MLGFPTIQKLVWYKPYSKLAHRFDIDKIIKPEDNQHTKHLFVDGSAYHQEYKELTIASYAVVEASFQQCDFTIIESGVLPMSEHNSFRGEVCGIIRALVQFLQGCHLL